MRVSVAFKILSCQREDGTEPLNELFARDLPVQKWNKGNMDLMYSL